MKEIMNRTKKIRLIEKVNHMNVFMCMGLQCVYEYVCASAVYADMKFSLKEF